MSQIYVLCNDILILVLDAEGSSPPTDKYETFTVLRLGKSLGGRDQPASIFGRPDRECNVNALASDHLIDQAFSFRPSNCRRSCYSLSLLPGRRVCIDVSGPHQQAKPTDRP